MAEPKKPSEEELQKILEDHEVWLNSNGREGKRADLAYKNLFEVNLQGANLQGANLQGANLEEANLHRVNLQNADLSKTILKNTVLSEASLEKANFNRANFKNANLKQSDLYHVNLRNVNLQNANLQNAYAAWANLKGADLQNANLKGANFVNANFQNANLDNVIFNSDTFKGAFNVWHKSLINTNTNIEANTRAKISELENRIREQQQELKKLSTEKKEELEKIIAHNEADKKSLQEALEKERSTKEVTSQQIGRAINHLKQPNNYINTQIAIQYGLAIVYLLVILAIFFFAKNYIHGNYNIFFALLEEKPNTIYWLTYASPLILAFSLILTLINQINNRIKRVMELYERKRYVESIGGGMNAILELMNANDAREKITERIDDIILNTIQREQDYNSSTLSDEQEKAPSLLTQLKEAKDLL